MNLFQFLVVVGVAAQWDKEAGSLYVVAPPELKAKFGNGTGKIPMSPALFGAAADTFGRKVTALTLYAPANDLDACNETNRTEIEGWPVVGPVILMVERGTCTFVEKTRHAQNIYASAVIVVDNVDEYRLPYMADDGTGKDIQIPAMLINKNDGAAIKKFVDEELKTEKPVIMTMAWDFQNVDNVVEWDFWTSADDDSSALQFKESFGEAVEVLGTNNTFTPHIFFRPKPYCKDLDLEECHHTCINKGRYCDHNLDRTNPFAYRAIQEDIRGICVFRQVAAQGHPEIWFDYAAHVGKECQKEGDDYFLESCSVTFMRNLGIEEKEVKKCITDSGGFDRDTDAENTIMEGELKAAAEIGVLFEPSIYINGRHYSNSIICPSPIDISHCGVLSAICKGFKDRETISACTSDPDCPLGQVKDGAGVCGGTCKFDRCDNCLESDDKRWDSCVGCDDKPDSGKVVDRCGICGGPGKDKCGKCLPLNSTERIPVGSKTSCIPTITNPPKNETQEKLDKKAADEAQTEEPGLAGWQIVLIILACMLVVGLTVYCFMQHRQKQLKEDIDALLKQYLPMDQAGALETVNITAGDM